MSLKTAIVTGITGQDGTYLAELLHANNVHIVGLTRKLPHTLNPLLVKIQKGIELIEFDYDSEEQLHSIIKQRKPYYFFNFAAHSTGSGMFSNPLAIGKLNGLFPLQVLEALKEQAPHCRFVQASSRECYGLTKPGTRLHEHSPRSPVSPYGIAKNYADSMVRFYRENFGIHASSAILFNHESPLRTDQFVTKKITKAAARIARGEQTHLELGSLLSQRDWGYAREYVEAMFLMANTNTPKDYVIATGKLHSVEDFCKIAFSYVNLDFKDYVRQSNEILRLVETPPATGDASLIKSDLGWAPKISFNDLVQTMVQAELDSPYLP